MNRVAKSDRDIFQQLINVLGKNRISYCVIGGLAVNAYAEPVVSMDLDIVIVADKIDTVISLLKERFRVKKYAHSVNLSHPSSDLRIQIQTDLRYQPFIGRAVRRTILGYRLPVATKNDVFQGKIWAAEDETRRPSKRQKDLADIMRLIEKDQRLTGMLPDILRKRLFQGK